MRVKLIEETHKNVFEKEVEEFINTHAMRDIKYAYAFTDEGVDIYSALIFYYE